GIIVPYVMYGPVHIPNVASRRLGKSEDQIGQLLDSEIIRNLEVKVPVFSFELLEALREKGNRDAQDEETYEYLSLILSSRHVGCEALLMGKHADFISTEMPSIDEILETLTKYTTVSQQLVDKYNAIDERLGNLEIDLAQTASKELIPFFNNELRSATA